MSHINAKVAFRLDLADMEEDRSEVLHCRIALYRRYLREGVNGGLAVEYLRQIIEDEAELERIGADRRED